VVDNYWSESVDQPVVCQGSRGGWLACGLGNLASIIQQSASLQRAVLVGVKTRNSHRLCAGVHASSCLCWSWRVLTVLLLFCSGHGTLKRVRIMDETQTQHHHPHRRPLRIAPSTHGRQSLNNRRLCTIRTGRDPHWVMIRINTRSMYWERCIPVRSAHNKHTPASSGPAQILILPHLQHLLINSVSIIRGRFGQKQ
jgi:hypothetical protein